MAKKWQVLNCLLFFEVHNLQSSLNCELFSDGFGEPEIQSFGFLCLSFRLFWYVSLDCHGLFMFIQMSWYSERFSARITFVISVLIFMNCLEVNNLQFIHVVKNFIAHMYCIQNSSLIHEQFLQLVYVWYLYLKKAFPKFHSYF